MSELWDPWEISESSFPKKGDGSDKLRFLLNYAILAPSSHNSQPWLFNIVGDAVELYADRRRALPVCDPRDRELTMACGASLFHLQIALRHFGYSGKIRTFPKADEPYLLARVGFGDRKHPSAEDELLFGAILKRRTNRMPFEPRTVPDDLLETLEGAAKKQGAWLHIFRDESDRNKVADLVAEGDRIQMANVNFRRELAAWIHQNRSVSHDGMPAYALGLTGLASGVAPLIVRTFDVGKGQAAKDRQLATGSPVLGLLGSEGDAPSDWLDVGRALDSVLLRARAGDVWASFLNQPIEVPELRSKLRNTLNVRGFPQLLIRMGYGTEVKPTPRRIPGEVLMRPLR
jgi:hypothetical protein